MSSSTPTLRTARLGLTGGIGSGKSTVAQLLVQCGAALIDADQLSRSVTGAGGTPGTDQCMGFVDKQDNGLFRGLYCFDDIA